MITDLSLIKACLKKDNYETILKHVHKDTMDRETYKLLTVLGHLYDQGVTEVPIANIHELWRQHTDFKDAELVDTLVTNLKETPDALVEQIVLTYKTKEASARLLKHIKEDAPINKIRNTIHEYEQALNLSTEWDEYSTNPEDIFKSMTEVGLQWRLDILKENVGMLRKGDFGIVGAYVDTGKTSFLCSELTHFARQVKDDRPIIYFNNEGLCEKIQRRLWTTALDMSADDIRRNLDFAKQEYIRKVGALDKIQVVNVMKKHVNDVEEYIRKHNPAFIVFDQLDHISGFERKSNAQYERFGYLYQWAREIAAEFCPVIAVTQADATVMKGGVDDEPRGQQYIGMHQLKGSKVDKQGTADFIVTIGSDLQHEHLRFINVPKNKLAGKKGRGAVNFNPLTGRYSNPGNEVIV